MSHAHANIDVLMITHRRAHYTRLTLERLLATCNENMRVWVWHNGDHQETLDVVHGFRQHPRFFRFHHCPENLKLRAPTNWLYSESKGEFVSKVDDDCMLPFGWGEAMLKAMQDEPRFGILSCWHFQDEDFCLELVRDKLQRFGHHMVLRNMWVGGSGYLMRRRVLENNGLIRERESFTGYCKRAALDGEIVGWYWPPLRQQHLDDPREPLTAIKSDEDLRSALPLSAIHAGVRTRADWIAHLKRDAREIQSSSIDPRDYSRPRRVLRRLLRRIKKVTRLDPHTF